MPIDGSKLAHILDGRPALSRLTSLVLEVWPEHESFLTSSYLPRTPTLLDTSEAMAAAVLRLAGGSAREFAANYRWLGDRVREEELNFARTGAYRYSTFEATLKNVYSNDEFMERYMQGLLYSHVLWYMHTSSLHFFRQRLPARIKSGGRVMEVGSGHGLLLYLALTEFGMAQAVAWDISPVSLEQTRHALTLLGLDNKRARFEIQDMHAVEAGGETFELIILSHLLEHLDNPVDALKKLRHSVAKGGYLFVNVPLNAPMPDHLQLLRDPADAEKMLADGGFRVVEMSSHTTQAIPLSRALKRQIAVTCSIIAEPV